MRAQKIRMQGFSKQYFVGDPRIDLEHQTFFALIKELRDAHEGGLPSDKLERILSEIVLYARFHCRREENFMLDIGYPGFAAHKSQHSVHLDYFGILSSGFSLELKPIDQIISILVNWFSQHVEEDKKIIAFANARLT